MEWKKENADPNLRLFNFLKYSQIIWRKIYPSEMSVRSCPSGWLGHITVINTAAQYSTQKFSSCSQYKPVRGGSFSGLHSHQESGTKAAVLSMCLCLWLEKVLWPLGPCPLDMRHLWPLGQLPPRARVTWEVTHGNTCCEVCTAQCSSCSLSPFCPWMQCEQQHHTHLLSCFSKDHPFTGHKSLVSTGGNDWRKLLPGHLICNILTGEKRDSGSLGPTSLYDYLTVTGPHTQQRKCTYHEPFLAKFSHMHSCIIKK